MQHDSINPFPVRVGGFRIEKSPAGHQIHAPRRNSTELSEPGSATVEWWGPDDLTRAQQRDAVPVHNEREASFCQVYRGAVYRASGILSRMDLRETFATNLRRLRNARGWSQDELAFEAKISRGYLSLLEKGEYYVSIKIIGQLADKLEVEPAEFLKRPAKSDR
ncbi:helix-turn-helix domain-containing protein [Bradyrhizobium sp. USDA 3364]